MTSSATTANYLDVLTAFVCDTRVEDVAEAVRQRGRVIIADCVAVIAAGMQGSEMQAFSKQHIEASSAGKASAFGAFKRTSPQAAALINGAAGTWLELDEGNLYAKGHTGIQVVPAALAHAQEFGRSGAELLRAVILGYEASARICGASLMREAVHPHGTYGVMGAAIAVALLRGFSPPQMRQVINIAATMAMATSRNTLHEGATVRNIYAGHAGLMGQIAVRMAEAGFTGERDGVGTIYGGGGVLSDGLDRDAVTANLGSDWIMQKNYFKLYCTGRYVHSAIDALIVVLDGVPGGWIDVEKIERIEVRAYKRAAGLNGKNITSSFGARFSIPFALATILYHRRSGYEVFEDAAVENPAVQALVQRVQVEEDRQHTAAYPQLQRCDLMIVLNDGERLTGHCELTKGDAANPHKPEELAVKFMALGSPIWGQNLTCALHEDFMQIERISNFAEWNASLDL